MSKVMDGKGLFSLCCFVYFSFLLLCVFLLTSSFQSLSILLACDSCDSPASAFQVVANMVECAMLNSHVFCFMGVLILLLLHLFTPRCLMFNVCFCSTSSLCGEAILTDTVTVGLGFAIPLPQLSERRVYSMCHDTWLGELLLTATKP